MNAMVRSTEVSSYFKQTNVANVFYSFPCGIEIELIKGMNVIHALVEIGHRSLNSTYNNKYTRLNARANDFIPTECNKSSENAEGKLKINEGWNKLTN